MNRAEAEEAAREYAGALMDIRYCSSPPQGLYAFDPEKEYLFLMFERTPTGVGGSKYLAVSNVTGRVRYAGMVGE